LSTSVSTPRIRLTQAMYALMVFTAALSDGRALAGDAALLAQAAGFVLVACGTLWRLWSAVFVAGRKDVEVVMEGPYARCRHPLYLGSLVAGLGLGLTTRSVVLATARERYIAGLTQFRGQKVAAWVEQFGVDLAWRARGVGWTLAQELLRCFREKGAAHAYTVVPLHDRVLGPFFRQLGFRDELLACLGCRL